MLRPGAPRPGAAARDVRALRRDLAAVDDDKLRRVVAMLDGAPHSGANRELLDPVRPRLAVLRPERLPRFGRLLFQPLDPVIVPARSWRPGEASVPRSALPPIAQTVRAAAEREAEELDRACRAGDSAWAIQAAEVLWSAAGAILADAPLKDWDESGVPLAHSRSLVRGIAAVLKRGMALRDLCRDAETGILPADDSVVGDVLRNLADEPADAAAMVVRIVLARLPHLAPRLKTVVPAGGGAEGFQDALSRGVETTVTTLERSPVFAPGNIADLGGEVRRTALLLDALERDPANSGQRRRLRAIRASLAQDCEKRFAQEIGEGLVEPLARASGPLEREGQLALEGQVRALRALETDARGLAPSAAYDRMLRTAATAVRAAGQGGILSRIGLVRMIELLSGPEAAEAVYRETAALSGGAEA